MQGAGPSPKDPCSARGSRGGGWGGLWHGGPFLVPGLASFWTISRHPKVLFYGNKCHSSLGSRQQHGQVAQPRSTPWDLCRGCHRTLPGSLSAQSCGRPPLGCCSRPRMRSRSRILLLRVFWALAGGCERVTFSVLARTFTNHTANHCRKQDASETLKPR